MGASASQTGLGSAEAPEPSGLGPTGAIPSAVRRDLNWGRNAIAFIRERGLAIDFNDWCGGWPCPVETDGYISAAQELRDALEALRSYGCPVCGGDCGSANPPVMGCPMRQASAALAKARGEQVQA